nr:hypothetical protein CFP56_46234 [Quercus suber]
MVHSKRYTISHSFNRIKASSGVTARWVSRGLRDESRRSSVVAVSRRGQQQDFKLSPSGGSKIFRGCRSSAVVSLAVHRCHG